MSAEELLMTTVRETSHANTLLSRLARERATDHQRQGWIRQLQRHLGAAHTAATALQSIAAGNEEPKRG